MAKNEEKQTPAELEALQKDKVKTKFSKFSEVIKYKLEQVKDIATMEHLMRVDVRLRKRMNSIKKMSQARTLKINGRHTTQRPSMFIRNLTGKKLNNEEAEIRFEVFEVDEKGDKKYYPQMTPVKMRDGKLEMQETNGDYRISHEVVEKIKYGKAFTREIIEFDEAKE